MQPLLCDSVAASGPAIWTSTYGPEPPHCNRLLVEPSCWAQTVHTFTLLSYVSRDLPYQLRLVLNAFFCSPLCVRIYDTAELCMRAFLFFLNSRCAVSVSVVRKINRPFCAIRVYF